MGGPVQKKTRPKRNQKASGQPASQEQTSVPHISEVPAAKPCVGNYHTIEKRKKTIFGMGRTASSKNSRMAKGKVLGSSVTESLTMKPHRVVKQTMVK